MCSQKFSIYLTGTSRGTEERTGSYKNTMWTRREREKWHTTAKTCLFGHIIKQDYSFRGVWLCSSTHLTNKLWSVNTITGHWKLIVVNKLL